MPDFSLKALRVNKGLTIAKAAKVLGVSESTVKSWEAGKTFPTQPHIEALCKLYGVTYDNIRFNA